MFRPVLRPAAGMSIQNLINKDTTESKGAPCVLPLFYCNVKK